MKVLVKGGCLPVVNSLRLFSNVLKNPMSSSSLIKNLEYSLLGFINATYLRGDSGSTVVKVLRYKSEGRWFDSRWFRWNFSLT